MEPSDPSKPEPMTPALSPEPPPPAGGFGVPVSGAEIAGMPNADLGGPWQPFEFRESVGFWPRAGARMIDLVATTLISMTAAFAGALVLGGLEAAGAVTPGTMDRMQAPAPIWTLVGFILPVFYDSIAESVGGTTIGKLILGYRVCRLDGRRPSFGQALGRNLAYFIDSLFFAVPAYRAMKSSPLNQRLGDKWAGTVVVRHSAIAARGSNVPFAFSARSGFVGIAIAAATFGMLSVAETVASGL